MSAQHNSSNTISSAKFSTLDIVGVSVSTLLFTIVWVAVFSIFIPERTSLMFSGGLKDSQAQELTVLNESLDVTQKHITEGVRGGVTSLLSIIQTGGSARGMTMAFTESVKTVEDSTLARVFPNSAVLGVATTDFIEDSNVSEQLLDQSYIYVNTVSFGLLGQLDRHFEIAMNGYLANS